MMYGIKKAREMGKSFSRRRSVSVEKRFFERKSRRKVRDALRRVQLDPELELEELHHEPAKDTHCWVEDCRRGRWSAPFAHWAERTTKDLPLENRLSHIMQMYGSRELKWWVWYNLHHMEPFKVNYSLWSYRYRRAGHLWTQEYMAQLLYEVVETPNAHRLLNTYIKQGHNPVRLMVDEYSNRLVVIESDALGQAPPSYIYKAREMVLGAQEPRLLLGTGDIGEFLGDLHKARFAPALKVPTYLVRRAGSTWKYGVGRKVTHIVEWERNTMESPHHHPEWYNSVKQFLELWVEHNRDVRAIHKALGV